MPSRKIEESPSLTDDSILIRKQKRQERNDTGHSVANGSFHRRTKKHGRTLTVAQLPGLLLTDDSRLLARDRMQHALGK